jgi:uncharacterized protein (TIGR04255 family)
MCSESLPKFRNPPVIETVLGVQFERLPKLGNAHLGAFWHSLGSDWPNVTEVHEIEPQFERFADTKTWRAAGPQLRFSARLGLRLQIRNADNNRMIQVQNGRLHYNWLGQSGEEYPSYDRVRPEFDLAVRKFATFLADESLGELRPNQWEVTYVNHIPRRTVWNLPEDWVRLLSPLAALPARGPAVCLESFAGEWHYEIEPQRGRLHANLSHGWRKTPIEQEVLVLNLTARGPLSPAEEGGLSLDQGLCLGHETIVRAFKDFTSEEAHKYWGLVYDES